MKRTNIRYYIYEEEKHTHKQLNSIEALNYNWYSYSNNK